MADKIFITPQQLQDDSFRLARTILNDGFRPDYIVGVWRGGTPVGIAVQEFLSYYGIKSDHIAVRTASYEGMTRRRGSVQVHGLGYIIDHIGTDGSLLIVDDVFDTGLSIEALIDELKQKTHGNVAGDIRVATVYYKPTKSQVERVPDYFLHKTDKWLVFPHEIHGLDEDEIRQHKPLVLDAGD
jgi:uncharacterized protein